MTNTSKIRDILSPKVSVRGWRAYRRCECGMITGQRCEWKGPRKCTIVVEHFYESDCGSHAAAGNSGHYPDNGAIRIRVSRECAAAICDGKWTKEVSL